MVATHFGSASVRFAFKWVWWLLAWLVASPSYASIISIQYQATELGSSTSTWQYAYRVSGSNILNGDSFSVDFGGALYSNLQDPAPAPNADWSVFTFQPQLLFAVPGEYVALADTDGPSLADLFTVTFTWLGGIQSLPGVQTFTVYDSAFNVLASSETSPLNGSPPPNSGG